MAREDRYLVHTSPSSLLRLQHHLPEQLPGSSLQAWGWQHWDAATTVSADVRLPLASPACRPGLC